MSRFMLPAAVLLVAAPVCVALAANPVTPLAAPQSGYRPVQMSQATPSETAPKKGPAAVRRLNEQSLDKAEGATKHSARTGKHSATASHKGGHATEAKATGGRTEAGNAAVERLNEQSLNAAKAGQPATGASGSGNVTNGGSTNP